MSRQMMIVVDLDTLPVEIGESARAVLTQKGVLGLMKDAGFEGLIEPLLRELGRNVAQVVVLAEAEPEPEPVVVLRGPVHGGAVDGL